MDTPRRRGRKGRILLEALGFICEEDNCHALLGTKEDLNEHKRVIHGILPFRCLSIGCNAEFTKAKFLGRHFRASHQEQNMWSCVRCPKTFQTQIILRQHMFNYHELGIFRCAQDGCDFVGDHREVVNRHAASHNLFDCPFANCGRVFGGEAKFKAHMRDHVGLKPYKCMWPGCELRAIARKPVLKHIIAEHLSGNQEEAGEYIDYLNVDAQMAEMIKEARAIEDQQQAAADQDLPGETSNLCETLSLKCSQKGCVEVVDNLDALYMHLKSVHRVLQFPCLALKCPRSFASTSQLGNHIRAHHKDIRLWQCFKCPKVQHKSYRTLHRHIWLCHQSGNFKCTYPGCDFTAPFRQEVKKHRSCHDRSRQLELEGIYESARKEIPKSVKRERWSKRPKISNGENRPVEVRSVATLSLKCTQCDLMFQRKEDLERHMEADHGTFPFRCLALQCNKSFETTKELGIHIHHDHADIVTWSCPECPVTFKSYKTLYQHVCVFHKLGKFSCTTPGCDFIGTCRNEVRRHRVQMHERYVCQYAGCGREFTVKGNFKTHLRMHFDLKLFHCTWPNCEFRNVTHSAVVRHVRGRHFKIPETIKEQKKKGIVDDRDPRKWIEKMEIENKLNQALNLNLERGKQPPRESVSGGDGGNSAPTEESVGFLGDKFEMQFQEDVQNYDPADNVPPPVKKRKVASKEKKAILVVSTRRSNRIAQQTAKTIKFDDDITSIGGSNEDDDNEYVPRNPLKMYKKSKVGKTETQSVEKEPESTSNATTNDDSTAADGNAQVEEEEEEVNKSNKEDEEANVGGGDGSVFKTIRVKCLEEGCGEYFPDKKQQYTHLIVDHKIQPYRCLAVGCNFACDNRGQLGSHTREKHQQTTHWPCSYCPKVFMRHHGLSTHVWQWHEEGLFACAVKGCKYEALFRVAVHRHKSVHEAKEQKFKCAVKGCGATFSRQSGLNRHVKGQHQTVRPYRCKWEGCEYDSQLCEKVERHIKSAHFGWSKKEQTNRKDRDAKQYVSVVVELLDEKTRRRLETEAVAAEALRRQNEGTNRRQRADGRKHICQFIGCGKVFNSLHAFGAHQRMHYGLKPYRCKWDGCSFGHENRWTVVAHIRQAHLGSHKEYVDKDTLLEYAKVYLEVVPELLKCPTDS